MNWMGDERSLWKLKLRTRPPKWRENSTWKRAWQVARDNLSLSIISLFVLLHFCFSLFHFNPLHLLLPSIHSRFAHHLEVKDSQRLTRSLMTRNFVWTKTFVESTREDSREFFSYITFAKVFFFWEAWMMADNAKTKAAMSRIWTQQNRSRYLCCRTMMSLVVVHFCRAKFANHRYINPSIPPGFLRIFTQNT